jgi:tetratricopeptide (TPR) repeat protein
VKKIRALYALGKTGEVFEKSQALLEDRNIVGWPRDKLFLSKIDAEIQEGRYREAFNEIKNAIETDSLSLELFDRLLDAYSALSDPKISFEELTSLYSKKSSYCPLLFRPEDRMQVEWDMIDYFLHTQQGPCIYLLECLEKYRTNRRLYREFVEIIRTNIRRIEATFEEKLESFSNDGELITKTIKKSSQDEEGSLELSCIVQRGINEIAGDKRNHKGCIEYIKNLRTVLYALGGDHEILTQLIKKEKIFKRRKTFFERKVLSLKKRLPSCLVQNGVAAIA